MLRAWAARNALPLVLLLVLFAVFGWLLVNAYAPVAPPIAPPAGTDGPLVAPAPPAPPSAAPWAAALPVVLGAVALLLVSAGAAVGAKSERGKKALAGLVDQIMVRVNKATGLDKLAAELAVAKEKLNAANRRTLRIAALPAVIGGLKGELAKARADLAKAETIAQAEKTKAQVELDGALKDGGDVEKTRKARAELLVATNKLTSARMLIFRLAASAVIQKRDSTESAESTARQDEENELMRLALEQVGAADAELKRSAADLKASATELKASATELDSSKKTTNELQSNNAVLTAGLATANQRAGAESLVSTGAKQHVAALEKSVAEQAEQNGFLRAENRALKEARERATKAEENFKRQTEDFSRANADAERVIVQLHATVAGMTREGTILKAELATAKKGVVAANEGVAAAEKRATTAEGDRDATKVAAHAERTAAAARSVAAEVERGKAQDKSAENRQRADDDELHEAQAAANEAKLRAQTAEAAEALLQETIRVLKAGEAKLKESLRAANSLSSVAVNKSELDALLRGSSDRRADEKAREVEALLQKLSEAQTELESEKRRGVPDPFSALAVEHRKLKAEYERAVGVNTALYAKFVEITERRSVADFNQATARDVILRLANPTLAFAHGNEQPLQDLIARLQGNPLIQAAVIEHANNLHAVLSNRR
jgi:hypothetical protein